MINNERIVPVQKIDFLSLIGTILNLQGESFAVLASKDTMGNFEVSASGDAGILLANQPVRTLDFASGVTEASIYFVAAYDFKGFTADGAAVPVDDSGVALEDIKADGITLYHASLFSGEVTLTAVTPVVE